jgi:hypothetical protein
MRIGSKVCRPFDSYTPVAPVCVGCFFELFYFLLLNRHRVKDKTSWDFNQIHRRLGGILNEFRSFWELKKWGRDHVKEKSSGEERRRAASSGIKNTTDKAEERETNRGAIVYIEKGVILSCIANATVQHYDKKKWPQALENFCSHLSHVD